MDVRSRGGQVARREAAMWPMQVEDGEQEMPPGQGRRRGWEAEEREEARSNEGWAEDVGYSGLAAVDRCVGWGGIPTKEGVNENQLTVVVGSVDTGEVKKGKDGEADAGRMVEGGGKKKIGEARVASFCVQRRLIRWCWAWLGSVRRAINCASVRAGRCKWSIFCPNFFSRRLAGVCLEVRTQ